LDMVPPYTTSAAQTNSAGGKLISERDEGEEFERCWYLCDGSIRQPRDVVNE
jgi:hypothetical protein